jgi:predicted acyl esterase
VSSDAPDTAFTVKLSERFADGRVYNIRDDISTLSMRNGASRRVGYKPGEEVEVMFDLTPILWRLKPGSSLRLDISSSSAPSFFPHPNRAGLWSAVADPSVARQSIYGGLVELPFE